MILLKSLYFLLIILFLYGHELALAQSTSTNTFNQTVKKNKRLVSKKINKKASFASQFKRIVNPAGSLRFNY